MNRFSCPVQDPKKKKHPMVPVPMGRPTTRKMCVLPSGSSTVVGLPPHLDVAAPLSGSSRDDSSSPSTSSCENRTGGLQAFYRRVSHPVQPSKKKKDAAIVPPGIPRIAVPVVPPGIGGIAVLAAPPAIARIVAPVRHIVPPIPACGCFSTDTTESVDYSIASSMAIDHYSVARNMAGCDPKQTLAGVPVDATRAGLGFPRSAAVETKQRPPIHGDLPGDLPEAMHEFFNKFLALDPVERDKIGKIMNVGCLPSGTPSSNLHSKDGYNGGLPSIAARGNVDLAGVASLPEVLRATANPAWGENEMDVGDGRWNARNTCPEQRKGFGGLKTTGLPDVAGTGDDGAMFASGEYPFAHPEAPKKAHTMVLNSPFCATIINNGDACFHHSNPAAVFKSIGFERQKQGATRRKFGVVPLNASLLRSNPMKLPVSSPCKINEDPVDDDFNMEKLWKRISMEGASDVHAKMEELNLLFDQEGPGITFLDHVFELRNLMLEKTLMIEKGSEPKKAILLAWNNMKASFDNRDGMLWGGYFREFVYYLLMYYNKSAATRIREEETEADVRDQLLLG